MKSYADFLLGVFDAVLDDAASWYPEEATEWKRDQTRLRLIVKTRGLKFLTIDLVAAGKHFDKCLAEGSFTPSRLPCQGSRRGWAIPSLFSGMLKRVFMKHSGKLRIDVDVTAVSFLRQLYNTAKKLRMTSDNSATFESVAEFFDIEKAIRPPTLDWDGDRLSSAGFAGLEHTVRARLDLCYRDQPVDQLDLPFDDLGGLNASPLKSFLDISSRFPGLLSVVQHVADRCSSALGQFELSEVYPRHGPGAVSDKYGESKFDFKYWPEKLNNLFDSETFAFYNAASAFQDELDGQPLLSKGEPPSKLVAVPKTQKAPRLIAAEPTAHQWMQQGILRLLLRKMDSTWLRNCVSIRDQSPSRGLALLASTRCHLSTVDLSSASDRVSCWLVERMFRANGTLLEMMHAVRTRWLVQDLDKKFPRFSKLRKFTTMGSALTFPVQSIIYAMVCVGVDVWAGLAPEREGVRVPVVDFSRLSSREVSRLILNSSRRVRVFGDDLIHPVESTSLLVEVLTYLGLKINTHKTFAAISDDGSFRESCGLDAYRGFDVTPCYVNEVPNDTEPESLISVVESSNNFHLRGLWRTADYLEKSLPQWLRKGLAVKGLGSGAFGLTSFVGGDVSHLKSRWNDQLHHTESLAYSTLQRRKVRKIRGSAALLQYFTENPSPDTHWESGVGLRVPLQLKRMGIPSYIYTKR